MEQAYTEYASAPENLELLVTVEGEVLERVETEEKGAATPRRKYRKVTRERLWASPRVK